MSVPCSLCEYKEEFSQCITLISISKNPNSECLISKERTHTYIKVYVEKMVYHNYNTFV